MEELILKAAITLPLLLLAVSVHEAAHALAALRLGDNTAALQGRISLYPPRHLDPIGSLALPLAVLVLTHQRFIYGYAKPTPVDPAKLRRPKRDYSLVALAGPLSNLCLAFALALAAHGLSSAGWNGPGTAAVLGWGIALNVLLGLFNLIPFPGFDGLKALYVFLPDSWCWRLNKPEPFYLLALFMVFWLGLFQWVFEPINRLIAVLCGWGGALIPF